MTTDSRLTALNNWSHHSVVRIFNPSGDYVSSVDVGTNDRFHATETSRAWLVQSLEIIGGHTPDDARALADIHTFDVSVSF